MKKLFLLMFTPLLFFWSNLFTMKVFDVPVDLCNLVEHGDYQGLLRYFCTKTCNIERQVNYCKVFETGFKCNLLHVAAENGDLDIVRFLVKYGAFIDVPDSNGDTPLALAADEGWPDIVKFLVENGADVSVKNVYGDTPLHLVSSGFVFPGCCDKYFWHGIFNYLAGKVKNVNEKNNKGYTPLHIVSEQGFLEGIKILLKKGADVRIKDTFGYTSLHNACFGAPFKVVKYLVENGAEPDINTKSTDFDNITPVLLAFWRKEPALEIISYLISKGAKIHDSGSIKRIWELADHEREDFEDTKYYLKTICKLRLAKDKNMYIFRKLGNSQPKTYRPFLFFLFCDAIQKILYKNNFCPKDTLLYKVKNILGDPNIIAEDKEIIKNKIAIFAGASSFIFDDNKRLFDKLFCYLFEKVKNQRYSSRFLKKICKANKKLNQLRFKLSLFDSLSNKKSEKDLIVMFPPNCKNVSFNC